MARDTNSSNSSVLQEQDRLAPSPLSDEIVQELTGIPPAQQNPYDHFEVIPVQQCIDHSEEWGTPAAFFGYGVVIGFDNAEEKQAFQDRPDRQEIENTLSEMIKADGAETLVFEMLRDEEYPNASHRYFTPNTIGDFSIIVDETIPIINETYGTNISGGFVAERSGELPPIFCDSSEPLPDNIASHESSASTHPKM